MDDSWAVVERARIAVGDRAGDRDRADDPLTDALTDELAGPRWHWSDDDAFRAHLPRLSAMFLS